MKTETGQDKKSEGISITGLLVKKERDRVTDKDPVELVFVDYGVNGKSLLVMIGNKVFIYIFF